MVRAAWSSIILFRELRLQKGGEDRESFYFEVVRCPWLNRHLWGSCLFCYKADGQEKP